ncbi:hypothetical protein [Methylorubrum salsuginis]|uniref:Bacteriophage Rz lysis protein n=1 Tax=Methylorubrum salsuginis TaxID=414703 RepID=A0A1I4MJK7_9HYPH|nr:hypothetical protein [Methylorubrum salsuginis]SFM03454.1 hypothetical protein SAMN04488125_13931 [Methylorubrum salsuginis]
MIARIAAALGLPVLPLAAAAALSAGLSGWLSYRVGSVLGDRAGYARGANDAGRQAEIAGLRQALTTARADRDAADAAASRASETAAAAEAARQTAEEGLDVYRQDLARRPRGACALDDADIDRLRPDHYRRPSGRDGAGAAPGR